MLIISFFITATFTPTLEAALDHAKRAQDTVQFNEILEQLETTYPLTSHFSCLPPVYHCHFDPEFMPMRWGNDILVDSTHYYQAVTIDARSDSVLFIAASRRINVNDTAHIDIRVSSDAGNTWSWFATIGGDRYPYDIFNPSLEIVEADDSIYLFVVYEAEPVSNPSDGFIGLWRLNFNTMTDTSFFVSDIAGVDEADPDIDADDIQYSYAPYLYCTWESSDSIVFARSVNRGKDWSERVILKQGHALVDYYNPNCAFGWFEPASDSLTIGVCWEYYHTLSGQKRVWYTFNWAYGHSFAWSTSKYFLPPVDCSESAPCIKALHQTSGVMIALNRQDTLLGSNTVLCKYTFDDDTWFESLLDSNSAVFYYPSLGVDDSCGRVHLGYSSITNAFYTNAHHDSLQQTGWSVPYRINGSTINDSIPIATAVLVDLPMASWIDHSTTMDYLVFDAIWNTVTITEQHLMNDLNNISLVPNPAKNVTRLYFKSTPAPIFSVEIFDVCGKVVKHFSCKAHCDQVYDYDINLSGLIPGVYFINLDTGQYTKLLKLVIVN